jgi:hypothetical protein
VWREAPSATLAGFCAPGWRISLGVAACSWRCNAKHRSFCAANAYDHRRLAAKRQVERIPFVERLNNIEKFIPNRALPRAYIASVSGDTWIRLDTLAIKFLPWSYELAEVVADKLRARLTFCRDMRMSKGSSEASRMILHFPPSLMT